jgi:hypothetical protein
MILVISVTDTDITHGGKDSCHTCPVARAAIRALGRLATITGCCMWIGDHEVPLPSSVRLFIRRFDAGLPVEAFTFTVDLPDDIAVSVAAYNLAEARECLHQVQDAIKAGHLPVLAAAGGTR